MMKEAQMSILKHLVGVRKAAAMLPAGAKMYLAFFIFAIALGVVLDLL